MSGIAGVFGLDGHAVEASSALCFDGRLDNREDLIRLCPAAVADAAGAVSDAALVLAAYERFGDGFASQLNGDFAVALIDSRRQQLLLARDVMAARALYYCPVPGAVLFASDIKSLLADPRVTAAPDEDGLADLVLNNWCDDHRTCFKGIYSVPPGHLVVASRDGIAIRPHWTFDPFREIRYGSFEEYRDCFRSLFEQSVRRRLQSDHPVAVTVSGGVDSSAIFCQAATLIRRESLPVRLHGISMTFAAGTAADEQAFLDDIERTYDTRIARVPVTHLDFVTNADAVVRQLEAPQLVPQTQAEISKTARSAGCRVLLHGFFGDQMLCDRGYLVDLARQGRWLKVRHDLQAFAAWMTDEEPGTFAREFRSRVIRALPPRWLYSMVKRVADRRDSATEYSPVFTKAFRERAHARASARALASGRFTTAHAKEYYRHATAGHYVRNVRLEGGIGAMHDVDVRFPFRDRDLVAFLMAIPGEIVNWQGVPKGLLRQALTGVLPDAVRDRRWKADFTELNERAVRNAAAQLGQFVPANSLAVRAGLVDGEVLGTAEGIDWRLPNPIGLEIWLRSFFGG